MISVAICTTFPWNLFPPVTEEMFLLLLSTRLHFMHIYVEEEEEGEPTTTLHNRACLLTSAKLMLSRNCAVGTLNSLEMYNISNAVPALSLCWYPLEFQGFVSSVIEPRVKWPRFYSSLHHRPQKRDDKCSGYRFLQAFFCHLKTGLLSQNSLQVWMGFQVNVWMPEIFKCIFWPKQTMDW